MNCWATLSANVAVWAVLATEIFFKNGFSVVYFCFLRAPVLGNLLCLPWLSPEINS